MVFKREAWVMWACFLAPVGIGLLVFVAILLTRWLQG